IVQSAIEVMGALQAIGPDGTGIGDEQPVPLSAELTRWSWLMERAPAELATDAPELATRLATRLPPDRAPVLVHGDYHFGNMLFRNQQVTAVLDWEIAELGPPLLDRCCL